MIPFLKYVAEDLIRRGLELSETVIVFPNKRAALFFDQYLYDCLQRPFWSPNYSTITELWQQFSSLQIADPILLNVMLNKVYNKFLPAEHRENFDEFYFWGELLLRDFDDLDKQLVDAKQLFQNVRNIRALENPFQYLTEEQIRTLNQFFTNFEPDKNSRLKERFVRIWSILGDIYEHFAQELKSRNLAYEGLLMRDVIENRFIASNKLLRKNYAFVGFNVLNTAEERLFNFFKSDKNALFYWDYDESFFKIPNHEAGIFLKRNLRNFENALENPDIFNNLEASKKTKQITFVASPTENAQARYANDWLKKVSSSNLEHSENAVVLCNEQLLIPLICALSGEGEYNITMGYPVQQMPITNKVQQLLSGFEKAEMPKETVLSKIIEQLKSEIGQQSSTADQLHQESVFRVILQLNRIVDLIRNHQLELSFQSLKRLIEQIFSTLTIPFVGEPVLGTQLMGVLETRNLDFKNLIMLSVNEGMLPKSVNDGSFIPYTLRKAFGLTIPEHKTAVYAYYFFRLMQRAENIALVYNVSTEGLNRGEMSRFMLQLMIENGFEIKHQTLSTSSVAMKKPREIQIPPNAEIYKYLLEKYSKDCKGTGLSPSAINTFLTCRLKFYLRYIIGLETQKQDVTDLDSATIGTWFHRSAEFLYRKISNQLSFDEKNDLREFAETLIQTNDLQTYLDEERREHIVDLAYLYEKNRRNKNNDIQAFSKISSSIPEYNGEELIARKLVADNLKRLIKMDIQKTPFTLLSMEKEISDVLKVGDEWVKIGGYIDRIDNVDGYLRIVDYKTGGHLKQIKSEKLHELFNEKKISENRNYLQALIYSFLLFKKNKKCRILPCLLHIHEAYKPDYLPTFLPNDFNEISDEFEMLLTELLNNIVNPNTEFLSTETEPNCRYCDYLDLCRKKNVTFS